MTEEHPFNNRTMYGATKIAGEQFFRAFYEQHGLDYVGLRYMNIYGPRMDYQGTYVSVIMKVLDRIDAGQPPLIFGDGSQAYDFVHVADVARANILSLKADATDDLLQRRHRRARPRSRSSSTRLLEITGSDLEPEYRPQEQMFVTHRVGSTELAERLLGFRAEVGLARRPASRSSIGGAPTARPRSGRAPRADVPARAAQALRVPIAKPALGERELEAVQQPLSTAAGSCRVRSCGQFEERFAAYTGVPHAVATTSCTTALHLAVAILGLEPGDEVIVPAFTWVSTANVVEYMGATPRLLRRRPRDVQHRRDADRGARSARGRSASSRSTCSGCAPTWTRSTPSPQRHGLWVVEDAACAFGAWQGGRHAGTLRRPRLLLASTRASRSPPARAACSPPPAPTGTSSRARCATTAPSRSDLARHGAAGRLPAGRLQPARLQLPDDRHPGRARLRADGSRRLDPRRAPAARRPLRRARWPTSRGCARRSTPEGNVHGYQCYCCLFAPEEPTFEAVHAAARAAQRA